MITQILTQMSCSNITKVLGKNLNNLDDEFWSGVPAFFLSKFLSKRLKGEPHLAM